MTVELLQLGQRAREVLHQRDRHVLERAGGRLGQRAVERRAVPSRHDEPGRAEHRGRAQDGADVVRVGHLVEHDQGPAGARSGQLLQVGLRQRLGLDQGALVHGIGAEPAVEVPRQHALVRQAAVRQRPRLQAALGVVGQKSLAMVRCRIGERRLDRVDAVRCSVGPRRRARRSGRSRPRLADDSRRAVSATWRSLTVVSVIGAAGGCHDIGERSP